MYNHSHARRLFCFLALTAAMACAQADESQKAGDTGEPSQCANVADNNANSVSWEQCTLYISAYIDGVLSLQSEASQTKSKKHSAFVDRAIRTRLGMREPRRGGSFNLSFCLPSEQNRDDIVLDIAKAYTDSTVKNALGGRSLLAILSDEYPC